MDQVSQATVGGSSALRLEAADATPVLQARRTLAQHGQQSAVDLIDSSLRRASGTPTIVVAGEVKRGKSMLVNALCGAALSPTNADTPSIAVVSIGPATEDLPLGWADVTRATRTDRVTVEQAIVELHPDRATDEAALMARLAHTSRWLPDAVLLDTPGVGGLGSVQGKRTSLAAAEAAALVFVTDAGQPITGPELSFLQSISENVEHVVLVLAKIDRNPTTWEEIRDENQRLLRTYAPRFAGHEIHPVSAAYAMHALTQTGDLAGRLEDASRIASVGHVLQETVADRANLAVANALRVGHSGLTRLVAGVDLEIRALSDPAVPAALEAEQTQLADLQRQLRRARMDLERDLGRIRDAAVRHVNDSAEALSARVSASIATEKRGKSAAVRDRFEADLLAELTVLAMDTRTFVTERLNDLVTRAFGSLDAASGLAESLPGEGAEVDMRIRTRPNYAISPLFDPSLAGVAFMGSRMGALAGGPLGAMLGVAGGGAMVALNVVHRNVREGRQDLAATLTESVAWARQELVGGVDAWLRELRPELHIALEDHLRAAISTVRGVLESAHAAGQADARARTQSLEQAVRRREALVLRRDAVQTRLAQITGPPPEQSA